MRTLFGTAGLSVAACFLAMLLGGYVGRRSALRRGTVGAAGAELPVGLAQQLAQGFGPAAKVTILGYDGDAMEPFLTRDGKYLFFNNLNEPGVNTNLYCAERVDDLTFRFCGEIASVNTPALEGVASMDRDGNFYFVSPRSYAQTASTLYRGTFLKGSVSTVELVPGVSLAQPGMVNFDAEISADGNTLYFVESQFAGHGPQWAKILIARRKGNTFIRDADSPRIFAQINRGKLNYAPATSPSELELYFTRVDDCQEKHAGASTETSGLGGAATSCGPETFVAKRGSVTEAFGRPQRISSITGFAEAPTVSPDGRTIYFHKKDGGKFAVYRVSRKQEIH